MCNFIVCVHLNSLAYIIYVLFYVGITSTSVISVDHYSLLRLSKCAFTYTRCHLLTNLKPETQRRLVRSVWLHVCCLKCILCCTYSIPNMFFVCGWCSETCMLFLLASVSQSSWCFWTSLPCCLCWMGSSWNCRIVLFLFWGVRGYFSWFKQFGPDHNGTVFVGLLSDAFYCSLVYL